MIRETRMSTGRLRLEGFRARLAQRDLAYFYGLLAILAVASLQLFFSVSWGGFYPAEWAWGVGIVMAALIGAVFVPAYLSSHSVGRKQWALVGALLLLTTVVASSSLWSISPDRSFLEASKTAMYVGVFILLLPAATRWGSLVVDATIFGALLPPAVYGLLQKILPLSVQYTGFVTLETDPKVSSTIGYHATFGAMCAMGALLVMARTGSFNSLRSIPLRAIYSATGVLFLVALYFSFSRGALLALAVGMVVLLALTKNRFEVLGNIATITLPALWVVSQAREFPGLIGRPVSAEVMETDGVSLIEPLLTGVLLALAAQALFTGLVWASARFVPERISSALRIGGTVVAGVVVIGGLFLGWSVFQQVGGFDELRSRVTTPDPEQKAEAITTDQTQRFSSLSTPRVELWKMAWENWREHPFTGTGADTYYWVFQEKAPEDFGEETISPHSIWMSLLSDTGIFAFLAFAAFCAGCLTLACYNAFSRTRSRGSRALIAGSTAAFTAYLVSASIDWNWYIPASTLPFFALAAVATAKRANTVPASGEPPAKPLQH